MQKSVENWANSVEYWFLMRCGFIFPLAKCIQDKFSLHDSIFLGPCTVCDPVAFEDYDWASANCPFNPLLYFHGAPQIVTNNASNSCTNGFYCNPSLYNTGMTVIRQHGNGKIKCTKATTSSYNNCNDEFSCVPSTGGYGNCNDDKFIATLCAKKWIK